MDTPATPTPAAAPAAKPPRPLPAAATPKRWPGLVVLALLVAYFLPLYVRHAVFAANPATLNASARQQAWPLMRYYDDQLFHNDAIADYFMASFPIAFKAVYRTLGALVDPRLLGRILTYVLLGITVWCAGRAARRVRGPAAGWGTAALCLGAAFYLERMTGGLPRAFAIAFLAGAMLALARGRPLLMAGIVVLSAGFYPVVSVVTGLALAVWLLLFPAPARGGAEPWNIGKRVLVVTIAAVLSVAMIVPTIDATNEWGPVLTTASAEEYKELSEGPYQAEDRSTGAFSLQAMKNFVEAPLAGLGGEWRPGETALNLSGKQVVLMVLTVAGLAGFVMLVKPSPPARRVLLVPAAAVAAYLLSALLAPRLYLPARYQLYPLAVAALVIVPAGIAHLATVLVSRSDQRQTQALVMACTVGLFVVIFAGYQLRPKFAMGELATAGLETTLSDHAEAYRFISSLPPRSIVAGWPSELDGVQYLTSQSALATRDGHQTFHRGYADLMRKRVQATIDALYARDASSMIRLRDELGVTHLVVSQNLYGPNPPTYFAPFGDYVKKAREALGTHAPAARTEADRAAVFADETWIILDLNRVRGLDQARVAD